MLEAVTPRDAIEHTREAFLRHRRGEWTMPPKVYLDSPPHGDFRAMPALGDGLAMLKWISSFPGNPAHGLPTVMGVVLLSDAATSEPLAIVDARSVTALRTGAVAAVAAQALAAPGAASAGLIGSGLHGAWAARCLAAAGYAAGVCHDPRADVGAGAGGGARRRLARGHARARRWPATSSRCVTPGNEPVVDRGRPAARDAPQHARRGRPGQGRGDGRRRRRVRAVLRRVGAGRRTAAS